MLGIPKNKLFIDISWRISQNFIELDLKVRGTETLPGYDPLPLSVCCFQISFCSISRHSFSYAWDSITTEFHICGVPGGQFSLQLSGSPLTVCWSRPHWRTRAGRCWATRPPPSPSPCRYSASTRQGTAPGHLKPNVLLNYMATKYIQKIQTLWKVGGFKTRRGRPCW